MKEKGQNSKATFVDKQRGGEGGGVNERRLLSDSHLNLEISFQHYIQNSFLMRTKKNILILSLNHKKTSKCNLFLFAFIYVSKN